MFQTILPKVFCLIFRYFSRPSLIFSKIISSDSDESRQGIPRFKTVWFAMRGSHLTEEYLTRRFLSGWHPAFSRHPSRPPQSPTPGSSSKIIHLLVSLLYSFLSLSDARLLLSFCCFIPLCFSAVSSCAPLIT